MESTGTPRTTRSLRTPFVGREEEFATLLRLCDGLTSGAGALVLIGGEAGIGKTRLCEELTDEAHARGFLPLIGHGYELETGSPFAPFIELIEQALRVLSAPNLRSALGESAPEVALLVPEVRYHVPDIPVPAELASPERRRALFHAVRAFLERLANLQPVLLVLEDLHWLDASSMALFQHLAPRLVESPVLMLGTYRDTEVSATHPLAAALHAFLRQRLSQELLLPRLSEAAVATILAAYGPGGEPPASLVSLLARETEGNPFFLEEVMRDLREKGKLFSAEGRWLTHLTIAEDAVPRSVRLVIEQRLNRLGAACQQVLAQAAVVGRNFDFALLEAVSSGDALAAIEEAQRASLVHDVSSGREARYSFTHELVRQTLLAGLSRPRRQRFHLQVAQRLAQLHAGVTADAAVIAHHLFEAGEAAEARETVHFLTLAGDQAVVVAAADDGLQRYDRALAIADGMVPGDEQRRLASELHAKRGMTFAGLGRWLEAKTEMAAAVAAHSERDERRAELLVQLCQACAWGLDTRDTTPHAREAVALAEELNRPDLVAAAIGWQGFANMCDGELPDGAASLQLAVTRAEESRVPAPPFAVQHFSHLLYWTGQLERSLQRSEQAIDRFRELNNAAGLVNVLPARGLALAASGRYTDAEDCFREAVQVGRRYGVGSFLARAVAMSAGPHLDTFDYVGAEELQEEARELARTFDWAPPLVSATIDRLFLAARRNELGRVDELAVAVEAGMEQAAHWHSWLWRTRYRQAQAEIALARRDWQEALRLSDDVLARSQATGRLRYEIMGLDTQAAALVGLHRTREALPRLHRALALARTLGDPALFLRPAVALLDLEGDPGLLDEATQTAHRVAAALPDATLQQRFQDAEPIRRFFSGLRTAPPSGRLAPRAKAAFPDGLSEREVEVLRLIAAGRSNQAIADELVISRNTVDRHISHIFVKMGAANRTEAAGYAHRNGLA